MDDMETITAASRNGWHTRPMFDSKGREVAWVAQKGPEIHFQVHRRHRFRAIQRNRFRAFARELMDSFGYLTTRVPHGDEHSVNRRFVERCGFVKTWSDTKYDYYMMNELPFERKT